MTGIGGYARTALALLLVVVLFVAALSLPDAVNGWYDSRRLGQEEYMDITFEPYELVLYNSFEEKLGAISACMVNGIELRLLNIVEGEDAPTDEELLAIVNAQLQELEQHGLFYGSVRAGAILQRELGELYPVGNCRDIYPQNVFIWKLYLALSDGSILVLRMDRDDHKVYTGILAREDLWDRDNIREWMDSIYVMGWEEHRELWCGYWGVEGDLPLVLEVGRASGKNEKGYGYSWCWGIDPGNNIYEVDANVMQVW